MKLSLHGGAAADASWGGYADPVELAGGHLVCKLVMVVALLRL